MDAISGVAGTGSRLSCVPNGQVITRRKLCGRRSTWPLALAIAFLVAASCEGTTPPPEPTASTPTLSSPSVTSSPSGTPSPARSTLDAVRIRLVQVAALEQPVAMAVRQGDRALYVAQKTGAVVGIRNGSVDP